MPMTQEEAEKLIVQISNKMDECMIKQDAESLSKFYHPNAVLKHDGEEQAIVGREGVKEAYGRYLSVPVKFENRLLHKSFSADGEYLILHGEFSVEGRPGSIWFEQIFRRSDNGDYLVYYQRRGVF